MARELFEIVRKFHVGSNSRAYALIFIQVQIWRDVEEIEKLVELISGRSWNALQDFLSVEKSNLRWNFKINQELSES